MNLVEAVFDCYGCRIPAIPADGSSYAFKIDMFRFGFAMNFGDLFVFGCWSDGDIYYFDGAEWQGFYSPPQKPKKQEFNRMIILCARALVERGDELSSEDLARLELAVRQVEASS